MKLIAKKEQSSDKKPEGVDPGKKAAAKPGIARPVRPKKADVVKKAEVPRKAVKKPGETPRAWVEAVRGYLREVVVELKRVVWPTRKETLGTTAVVLLIVALCGVFLGIVDLILSRLVKLLVG